VTANTSEGLCGYYPERIARNHTLVDGGHQWTIAQRTRVLAKGYRRFGFDYYRPFCRECRECTPYRVIVAEYEMSRRFRRTIARNSDVTVSWSKPQPTQEKFELYVRYQILRHKHDDLIVPSRKELAVAMMSQMYLNPEDSLELVLSRRDAILGFAVFDRTLDSLSAVYSVYDPEMKDRSFGTFAILLAIQKCAEIKLPYLNLGLFLSQHAKMAYKSDFKPAEIYNGFRWQRRQV